MSSKPSKEEVKKLFKQFDNGNGRLSLAELDKALLSYYPDLASNKKAILRAYKAADSSGNGLIELKEFEKIVEFIDFYRKYGESFKELDANGDQKISLKEFKRGFQIAGEDDTDDDYLKAEFNKIDTDKGGFILFDEFCSYMANKKIH